MAIAIISNWLDGRQNFDEGFAIYKKYGDNEALVEIFDCGPNRFTIRKLTEALEELNGKLSEEKIITEKIDKKTLPADIKILHDNTMNLYKDMATKHQQLDKDMSEDQRKILASEILDADDTISANFEIIDHYHDTGERKPQEIKKTRRGKEIADMSPVELMNALSSIPTYITKAKKQLKKEGISPEKVFTISGKIAMYENDLKEVKLKLGI